jgi:ATP phosphoribosyltransferase
MREKSRKLIFEDTKNKLKFILVKASDVPTYVEYGAADIGIVGKDTIMEEGKNLYELLDLVFGKCKMSVGLLFSLSQNAMILVMTVVPEQWKECSEHTLQRPQCCWVSDLAIC